MRETITATRFMVLLAAWFTLGLLLCPASDVWAEEAGAAQVPRVSTIDIRFSRDGTPQATLSVNGKARVMQVDTAMPVSLLSDAVVGADKIGTKQITLRGRRETATDEVDVRVSGLKLAIPFVVQTQAQLDSIMGGERVDGILGANMLAFFTVLFDFPARKLSLLYPPGPSPEQVSQLGFADAARLTTTDPGDDSRHAVSVTFAQGKRQGTAMMFVDTGAGVSLVPAALSHALELVPSGAKMLTVRDGQTVVYPVRVGKVRLGGLTLRDVDLMYYNSYATYLAPLLGMNMLSKYRIELLRDNFSVSVPDAAYVPFSGLVRTSSTNSQKG